MTHARTHTCTHTHALTHHVTHARMHTCTHTHALTHHVTHARTHTCTHALTPVHTHSHMYAHTHSHKHTHIHTVYCQRPRSHPAVSVVEQWAWQPCQPAPPGLRVQLWRHQQRPGQVQPAEGGWSLGAGLVGAGCQWCEESCGAPPHTLTPSLFRPARSSSSFQKSTIHNWGLFAMEAIAADEIYIEYMGEQHVAHPIAGGL